ncbi:hypothetical protein MNBD_ALPHA06-1874 [hydrothermal vent metagenome]|uniref:DUF559 domain-containing protein n=1 Tax=hydrothermal vent metagenome TaxID=652676 RepID=A0A3B0S3R6_9ZZZZ
MAKNTHLARNLRQKMSDAERRLWYRLRGRRLQSHKFRRQVLIGPYIADFVCESAKLIIEADGGQHVEQTEADALRTAELEAFGYHVIRFWNHDILQNTEGVLTVILDEINLRSC